MLWEAKHIAAGKRTGAIALDRLRKKANRMQRLDRLSEMEERYEHYPYIAPVAESGRLVPHYVVRTAALDGDMRALLGALRCGPRNGSSSAWWNAGGTQLREGNLHKVVADEADGGVEAVRRFERDTLANFSAHLRMGDERSRMLQAVAKGNKVALRYARLFR